MMPDLGRYAAEVLWSYAGGLGLLAVLVGLSVRRARKVAARLAEAERRHAR
ncbi:heme exporter protein CcmD [Wenxinia marina]|uniref:Heme exporter protein D n=1 Tax=Wenxinia marina DSM 24838 TaxID=1123501 RepID=A0A0D0Q2V9_9RHOB|nr:heme exporter protein CcmD [Wenxinia marina]KIQ68884.1 heme exporter protein CcmD [Wenxinia marina DSM 24838]GGL64439.1 hypothetical protein GCM10011392_18880 [Wenxinia marina]